MTDFEDVKKYIESLYDGSRKEYLENTSLKEFTPVIDDDAARLLEMIISMKKPARILEIGTSVGFSTISMARTAARFGTKIKTIEYDGKVADQAGLNFEHEDFGESIEILRGDAVKILREMNEKFDMIFMDFDKNLYSVVLKDCIRNLSDGGILVADDTLFPVEEPGERWGDLVNGIIRFNRQVADDTSLRSTILPVGDGMTLIMKR